jgi:diadenosine tetraphosphate (Ap4A) HIT family hydrolase
MNTRLANYLKYSLTTSSPIDAKYTCTCLSCAPFNKKECDRTILINKYCKLVLREDDQNKWFARAIVVPLKHINPFEKMTTENGKYTIECLRMAEKYASTLKNHFGITNINILQIGNLTRNENDEITSDINYFHVHYHILPRSLQPIIRPYRTFVDDVYGEALNINPKQGHDKKDADPDIIRQIKYDVQSALINDENYNNEDDILNTNPDNTLREILINRKQYKRNINIAKGITLVSATGLLMKRIYTFFMK